MGYWVAPWARRGGVATAATRALTRWAFGHGAGRVELMTERSTLRASGSRWRSGFRYEGVRRARGRGRDGSRHDLLVWSRLPDDSRSRSRACSPTCPTGG